MMSVSHCGSLNENGPNRLTFECLATREWYYLQGLKGLGGGTLLEEVTGDDLWGLESTGQA